MKKSKNRCSFPKCARVRFFALVCGILRSKCGLEKMRGTHKKLRVLQKLLVYPESARFLRKCYETQVEHLFLLVWRPRYVLTIFGTLGHRFLHSSGLTNELAFREVDGWAPPQFCRRWQDRGGVAPNVGGEIQLIQINICHKKVANYRWYVEKYWGNNHRYDLKNQAAHQGTLGL